MLRNSVWLLVVKSCQVLLAFVSSMFIARWTGASNYGVYAFALSVATLLGAPSQMGLPVLVVRETARCIASNDVGKLTLFWRWARGNVLFSCGLTVGVAFLLLSVLELADPARENALFLALALVPAISLLKLSGAALQGLNYAWLGATPDSLLRPLLLLVFAYLFHNMAENLTGALVMLCHVVAAWIALIFSAHLLVKLRPNNHRHGATVRDSERAGWTRAVWPLALLSGAQVINAQIDTLMLGLLRPHDEVGAYRVAVQLSTFVAFGLTSLNLVVQPRFVALIANRDTQGLQVLASKSSIAFTILAMPPAVVFWFWGDVLLSYIYGQSFLAAEPALAILAFGQLMNASMGSVAAILNMAGYERDTTRAVFMGVVLNVALNLVLIPLYGLSGAAIASVAGLILWNVILAIKVYTKIRVLTFPGAHMFRMAS